MYTLCTWCREHVMLSTHCVGGAVYTWYYVHVVHVVLCVCRTCCIVYMRYYVCALCSRGIMMCVFIMLYIYVLCFTSGVSVCIVWWCTLDVGVCIVLCCILGVGVCVVYQV